MHGAPLLARRTTGWPRRLSLDSLAALQAGLLVVALVQFLRCCGPAYIWVLLSLTVPALRWLRSAAYRQRMGAWLRQEWASIECFADDHARLPWRATVRLIVLPAGLFFLSQGRPLMTGDSKPITLIASALVRDGTTDLSAFAASYAPVYHVPPHDDLPYFCQRSADSVYSCYHAGMVVFALPSAALARMLGADLASGGAQDRMEKGVASWLAAACLGLFFLLALHRTDARSAGLMTLLLATGSGVCSTVGQALWQHGGVLFWLLLALLLEYRTWRSPRLVATLLQGIALAMMFACRLPSAVFIAAFGLWLLCRAPRRALVVGLSALLVYAPWACYYYAIYSNVLGPSWKQHELFTAHWRDTLLPLLVSPDHGLLIYQPWILLALTLLLPSIRRLAKTIPTAMPPGWTWFCVLAVGPYLALVGSWYCWWGGQCWGSRLLVETLPFFALLCLPPLAVLRRLAWGRRLLLVMALLAAFVQLTGVYLKADCRDTQPALLGTQPEPPGSWTHLPFLTPFVGRLHG
jgi:hypothetical protein